jgi:hypothetical protein
VTFRTVKYKHRRYHMGYMKNEALKKAEAAGERLVWSAEHRDEAGVREALEAGAWVETWSTGDPDIHGAAMNGHIETIRLLLEHGAHVNSSGTSGSTPLHRCIGAHTGPVHAEIVRMLLAAGADIGAANDRGHRAYDYVEDIEDEDTRDGIRAAILATC